MLFRDVIGHEEIKKRLIHSAREERVSHAQLFLGPEGSGNLALAIAFAQYISCENQLPEDSCGECKSCKKYQKYIHPDLYFVYPVNTAKGIKKDPVSEDFITEWREALTENKYLNASDWYDKLELENKQGLISVHESETIIHKLNLKAYESKFKIMIIWLPEKMNIQAANKLLKIIEEPPENTFFFLVSENNFLMLPTIISRTQLIKVNKVSDDLVKAYIKEQYPSLSNDRVNMIVFTADGNLNMALKGVMEETNTSFSFFRDWLRVCYSGKVDKMVEISKTMATETREKQKEFLLFSLKMFRECFLKKYEESLIRSQEKEEIDFFANFSKLINLINGTKIIAEFNRAIFHVERNVNSNMVFLDLSIKMNSLLSKKN